MLGSQAASLNIVGIPRSLRHPPQCIYSAFKPNSCSLQPAHFYATIHHGCRAFPKDYTSSSSSEPEDDQASPGISHYTHVDPALLAAAERSIASEQAAGLPATYDIAATKRIVETAMLAAIAGLTYSIATLLKLEGYFAYVLPLPIVLAALRGGPVACLKSLTVAFLLLVIIVGPFRALAYLLIYGLMSLSMGASWALKLPWAMSIPVCASARMAGYLLYFVLSSFLTNENLLALVLYNLQALIDQMSAWMGSGGAPSATVVGITLACLTLVQCVFYVSVMHLLYTVILRQMGYDTGPAPRFIQKLIGGPTVVQTI